jgi:hypothetical protein
MNSSQLTAPSRLVSSRAKALSALSSLRTSSLRTHLLSLAQISGIYCFSLLKDDECLSKAKSGISRAESFRQIFKISITRNLKARMFEHFY